MPEKAMPEKAVPEEAIISVEGLTVRYGSDTILEDVSFTVREGEILAILGGSGCGKSTLMRHMTGLETPAAGRVRMAGWWLDDENGRDRALRQAGILFQSGALIGSMTVAENVALPIQEYSGLSRDSVERLVYMKLGLVGLACHGDHLPSVISGGMKKRAGLARALALNPRILFLDEPSAGLDPITSAHIDALILDINRRLGTTMVIVTHELASIFAVAQRAIMLDKSTRGIIAEGNPHRLKDESSNPRVRRFFNREPDPDEDEQPHVNEKAKVNDQKVNDQADVDEQKQVNEQADVDEQPKQAK